MSSTQKPLKVSFLGLGVMGFPMAGHLVAEGHQVTVFNRDPRKTEQWTKKYSGHGAATIGEAVAEADIVCACVGNDADSMAVSGVAMAAMAEASLYIDHTTSSAMCAKEIAERGKNKAIGFIDAPVSGGEAGAINGQLSIMCGGSAENMQRAEAVMQAYAKRIVHIGPVGQGQLCKAVNQIAIAGVLQGLSEAVHFAKRAGLDMSKVLEAVSGGAAQSWQMDNRAKTMAEGKFDFGFAVDWMRKDLAIALAEAELSGATLPMTALIDQFYKDVQQVGGNRWDTSSLITRLESGSKGVANRG